MKTSRKVWLAAAMGMALTLTGCFHDSSDDTPPAAGNGTEVPDSAGASVSAFISYLMALKADDETSEPATLKDSFEVPPDESNDPQILT